MKTKKQSIGISSIVAEFILQCRNSSYEQLNQRIVSVQTTIKEMHRNKQYSKQLYFQLVEKQQYGIEQKLVKENRILKNITILIHFKLTQKLNSHISFIESWQVSIERHSVGLKSSQIDCNQELAYLLQQVLQALKCQFLADFSSMGQSFRSKYIMDYEVEVNPGKKSLKRVNPLQFEQMWRKQAFLDEQNRLAVTCYHNTHRKLQSIIWSERQQSRSKHFKLHVKKGSQQTKPSNSGEYELSTSIEEKKPHSRERKTSLIQFHDDELNITVLSNDGEPFKKSTGKMEQIFIDQDQHPDSDDEFQLLIQQSAQQQLQRQHTKKCIKIKQVQKQLESQLFRFDQLINAHFFI